MIVYWCFESVLYNISHCRWISGLEPHLVGKSQLPVSTSEAGSGGSLFHFWFRRGIKL